MQTKKLLIVGDFIAGSGVTSVIFNVFSKLPPNYKVTCVGYGINYGEKSDKATQICKKLNWKLYRTPSVTKNPIKHWLFWFDFLKKNQFDCAYFNYSSSWNFLPIIFARKSGIERIICHSHNSNYSHKFKNKILMRFLDKLNNFGKHIFLENTDYRVATSKEAAKWMFGSDNIPNLLISLNGINTAKFKFNLKIRNELRKKYNIENKLVIGFVGVMQPRKDPIFALNVFNEYKKINNNSAFILIGEGELDSEIDKKIDELRLNQDIIRIKYTSEIEKWYSCMDVLLFTSDYEGMPLVLLEAQASGLNILTSPNITNTVYVTNRIKKMKNKRVDDWVEYLKNLNVTVAFRKMDKKMKEYDNTVQYKRIKNIL